MTKTNLTPVRLLVKNQSKPYFQNAPGAPPAALLQSPAPPLPTTPSAVMTTNTTKMFKA